MDSEWARLQTTLRAIERGERLASIDDLLIRRVLQQAPPKITQSPSSHQGNKGNSTNNNGGDDSVEVQGSDAYRVLLALRKQNKKKQKEPNAVSQSPQKEIKIPNSKASMSPPKATTMRAISPTKHSDTDHSDQQQQRILLAIQKSDHHQHQQLHQQYREEMQQSLAKTQRQLEHSQHQVRIASDEMDALLAASQSVLSSTFLFERNLTDFCQERSLEVIQRVLQRLKNRFYKLFYRKWVDMTAFLRLQHQKRAACTIIRVFRGYRARKLRRLLQNEAVKVRLQAKQVVELRVSFRHHQALKIQRVWTRFQWRQREKSRTKRTHAVRYLQRQWRDRKLRQNAIISVLLNLKSIRAAIQIQKIVKGFITRRRVTRQRNERRRQAVAMAMLTRNSNRQAMLQWQLERRGASFVICRALFPVLIREKFRKIAHLLKKKRAGKRIAGFVWLWWARRALHCKRQQETAADKLRVLVEKEHQRIYGAAVVIQKHVRRWWYQQQYEMQRRRNRKLLRLERIKIKAQRLQSHHHQTGNRRSPAVAASVLKAGLVDVMKQAKKTTTKGGAAQSAAPVEGPEIVAARRIQRAYLRHRHHVRFRWNQWRQKAINVENWLRTRREAAILIQKRVRGMQTRRKVRIIRAQRLVRQYIRQWKWKRAHRKAQAATRIVRWLKHKQAQRLVVLWRLQKQRRLAMATKIQQWLRRGFFYRQRIAHLLQTTRKQQEATLFATQSLVVCVQHLTDALILQSSQATAFDDGIKSYVRGVLAVATSAKKPPTRVRFPLLAVLFLVVSGLKDASKWFTVDLKELLATKMERSKVIAMVKAANKHGIPTSSSSSPKKPRKHKIQQQPQSQAETFTMTDVDLAMAKAAGASKRALVFPEFVETLQSLADTKLIHITVWWNKYDGPEARLLALLWQFVFKIPDLQPFVDELHAYTIQVVNLQALVVQRLFKRTQDAARGHILKLQLLQQHEMDHKRHEIIKVQACVRRRLARTIYKSRICELYDKYIDPEWGCPYWLNRKTGFSTWQKPWALQDDDVTSETVPFPPPEKRVVVQCEGQSGCETCSDWFCDVCDEFFCDACVKTYHKTPKDGEGSQVHHEMERLHKCGLCQFQVASRECTSCHKHAQQERAKKTKTKKTIKSKPKPVEEEQQHDGQDDETRDTRDREALFCDVCFAFAHRRGALQAHKAVPLVELCDDCHAKDDALLDHEKLPKTTTTSADPTQKIYPRTVQWLCTSDKRRVCSACAVLRHPVEACGELTPIRITTLQMKARADRKAKELADRERMDTELIKQKELLAKQQRCAKTIQRFWSNSMPLMRARRVTRALRQEKDTKWKQIQQDAVTQSRLPYRLKNALGLAPPLPSDSVVARKLREMTALQRRQLGIRARLFGLLIHEYMQLGVPLPGIARVKRGHKYVACSEDLRGWILNRQTLRLKKLPTKAQRDRARRIKARHHRDRDGYEPAERLEDRAWLHDLEQWMKNPEDSVLVDVDAKQRIAERTVPLASAFGEVTVKKPTGGSKEEEKREKEEEEEEEEEEYAMFLVEFSMDPTRVVWISHSLAERFAVWRRQKLREYQERRELEKQARAEKEAERTEAERTKPTKKKHEVKKEEEEEKEKEEEEEAATASATIQATDVSQAAVETEAAWAEYYANANNYDYNNYYGENAWTASSSPGDAGASLPYPSPGYESYGSPGGYTTTTTETPSPPPLVDSSNYFYAEDGNAAAWQAYYQTHPEPQPQPQPSYGYEYPVEPAAPSYADPSSYYAQAVQQQQWPATEAAATSYYDNSAYDYYDQGYYGAAASTTVATAAATGTQLTYPWEEVFDPATQQSYYYNHATQQTSWEYPSTT